MFLMLSHPFGRRISYNWTVKVEAVLLPSRASRFFDRATYEAKINLVRRNCYMHSIATSEWDCLHLKPVHPYDIHLDASTSSCGSRSMSEVKKEIMSYAETVTP